MDRVDKNQHDINDSDVDDDQELGISDNIKPVSDDDEEFKKFMKSDTNEKINKEASPDDVSELISKMSTQLSPPLPPPPPPPQHSHKHGFELSMGSLPSPPPLPSQTPILSPHKPSAASLLINTNTNLNPNPNMKTNFNSFGRSNTLDRKSSKLGLKFNEKPLNYQNFTNSLERKTITDSENSSYRLFKANQQISTGSSPQRNSLNLTLKPPSPNPSSQRNKIQPASVYVKRPLSQDTILENSAYLLDLQQKMQSTPTSPEHYGMIQNQSKLELDNAKNQIFLLTNQLNTNAQVVNTLEQSISVLTYKIQKMTLGSQKKDNTIAELRNYIEFIHKKYAKVFEADKQSYPFNLLSQLTRHNSNESLNSMNSMFSQRTQATSVLNNSYDNNTTNNTSSSFNESFKSDDLKSSPSKKKNWLRSSFRKAFHRKNSDESTSNKLASPSANSNDSGFLNHPKSLKCLSDVDENDLTKHRMSEFDDLNGAHNRLQTSELSSLPNSPLHQIQSVKNAHPRLNFQMPNIDEDLEEYQRVLREKECKLTDIRLEALATAHQLDSQKEENLKMKNEIEALKMENLKLQSFLNTQFNQQQKISPTTHQSSICSSMSSPSPSSSISSSSNSKLNLSLSTTHVDTSSSSILTPHSIKLKSPAQSHVDGMLKNEVTDGKRVCVTIYLGDSDPLRDELVNNQVFIGSLNISTRTNWETLDGMIKNVFKEYLDRLNGNAVPTLGLNISSIKSYYVGEMPRIGSQTVPDLLPYGYLVGNHTNIIIKVKQVNSSALNDIDMLCYETLVQKSRMQCYISLTLEFKNLLFCGPNGTCKSYLARKLGEFLVNREDKDVDTSIAYFNVENKSSRELKMFLSSIYENENVTGGEVPLVLILDNLENIGNNSDVFQEFFSAKNNHTQNQCSYVIGTINQSDVSSLNLHQNFKWVLCANHTEPVKSYLNRHLQRRLIDFETKNNTQNQDLEKIVNWIPKLWLHINKYIEQYNSNDLALGPKLFSAIPLDFKLSLNWFIELWNNHLVPFMIETIKEGVQVYGTKMSWEDPKIWIASTFPWTTYDMSLLNNLHSIEPHHVGFDTDTESSGKLSSSNDDDLEKDKDFDDLDNLNNLNNNLEQSNHTENHQFVNNENDKLLNMLIRLQECTNGTQSSRPVSTMSSVYGSYDMNSLILNESTL